MRNFLYVNKEFLDIFEISTWQIPKINSINKQIRILFTQKVNL